LAHSPPPPFPTRRSSDLPTNVRAPHFDTNDIFLLTYHWLPELSTVTSYTFQRIKYESSSASTSAIGAAQDRFQNTLAERLQYSRSEEHTSELQSPDHLVC